MNKILLSLIMISLATAAFCQSIVTNGDLEMSGKTTDTSVLLEGISLTNITSETLTLGWTIERTDIPDAWVFQICDLNLCLPDGIETCPESSANVFAPNVNYTSFAIKVKPNTVAYDGSVKLNFYPIDDPSTIVSSINVTISVSMVSAFDDFDLNNVSIYPNPSADYFKIKDANDVDHIAIYNIVGKKIEGFDFVEDQRYYVDHLNTGLYLVRLLDETGKNLKVLRLNKK